MDPRMASMVMQVRHRGTSVAGGEEHGLTESKGLSQAKRARKSSLHGQAPISFEGSSHEILRTVLNDPSDPDDPSKPSLDPDTGDRKPDSPLGHPGSAGEKASGACARRGPNSCLGYQGK
ncbi:hypothetical protein KM043_008400 [Ampulex compressa]|nr:hypothetical protein KM043_008400 [Ampulex compressa]